MNTSDRINALFANQPTTSRARVGDRFTHTTSHPYTTDDGKVTHEYDILWEVTETDESGITCRQIEVLAERNRPTLFTPRNAPTGTSIAHFAVERYSDTGAIVWTTDLGGQS